MYPRLERLAGRRKDRPQVLRKRQGSCRQMRVSVAVIAQELTADYALYNGDCVEVLGDMADSSAHLSLYSPPFCGLYVYSSSDRDLSNARTYDEFFDHYAFVVSQVLRVTMPGRCSAVHCMDAPGDGANTGGNTI